MDDQFQPAPHKSVELKPHAKRSLAKSLFGIAWYVFVLSLVFIFATGAAWIKQSPLMETMATNMVKDKLGIKPKPPEEVFGDRSVTLLILGCDQNLGDTYSRSWKEKVKREFLETGERPHISRKVSTESARTDMMLVARLDFANKRITGLSIPRDLEVALPGYHAQKINAYHTYGDGDDAVAEQITKEAVEYVLPGVHIDRVVTLDYDAFQRVVDMVGGVPVNVEKDLQYVDVGADLFINLKKGRHVLDGYDAMGFVRFRHTDSDFKRQERQKEFLVSLKQEVMRPENIWSVPQILEQAKLLLGRALTDDEIASLAEFSKTVPQTSIQLGMLPIRESRRSSNLFVDEDKLPEVMADFGLSSYQVGSAP